MESKYTLFYLTVALKIFLIKIKMPT